MITAIKTKGKNDSNHIAGYAATSAAVLHQLSKHCNVQVRIAVADNENTSAITSMILARDDNPDLRYALAENHHIDRSILDLLATDANPFVADRARRTILRLKEAVNPLSLLRMSTAA